MAVIEEKQEIVSLNIMPMLDIFSILILFLLMNFATDPLNHDLNKNVELPFSGTLVSLDDLPTIIVSRKEILVNDKKVIDIAKLKRARGVVSQGAITPLFRELEKMRVSSKLSQKNKVKTLTLEIDKKHKFSLVKKVMRSAQQADFMDFKLMVAKEI